MFRTLVPQPPHRILLPTIILLLHACMRSGGKAMPSCVCCPKKIFKIASNRVTRAFKDVILNEKQPTKSYWNVYVPDISQGGFFQLLPIISFLAPPLSKSHVIFTVSKSNRSSMSTIWQCVHNEEVCGVRIHSSCLSVSSV